MKFAIVASRFNEMITDAMVQDCLKGFKELNLSASVIRVPGAMEIPIAAQDVINKEKPDAIVALGCVIKGETEHYQSIAQVVPKALMDLALKNHIPIIVEILMADTYQKAEVRINKAYHAASVAKEMAELIG